MANGNIEISLEAVAHDAIKETVQGIYDQTGIRVDEIKLSWIDESIPGSPHVKLAGIELRTTKRHY